MAGVRRFQIMALLQAARAYRLGLKLDEAKSWGLCRAIFYAAARFGFRSKHVHTLSPGGHAEADEKKRAKPQQFYVLGGERGNLSPQSEKGHLRFQMGGQTLSPYDFDRQIKLRFGDRFEEAWDEAMNIIDDASPKDLQNQQRFFNAVYKPRRDELAVKYGQASPPPGKVVALRKKRAPRKALGGTIQLVQRRTKKSA